MIRLFVAIGLPEEQRMRLASLVGGIDGARWVAEENYHVTLQFIGEVTEDTAPELIDTLDRVVSPGFDLTLEGTGHFGTGRQVRSLWAGVRRSDALDELHASVARALLQAGIEPEGRRFTPHVTLARLKGIGQSRVLPWLESTGGFLGVPFRVDRFTLFESRLGRAGPVYTPVAEFPIG